MYLIGDFNIDYSRSGDVNKQRLKALESKYNMSQIVKLILDWDEIIRLKREERNLIIRKKQTYICIKLYENRNIPRKFWKEINNNLFIGKNKASVTEIRIRSQANTIIGGHEAACEINNYYAEVRMKLAQTNNSIWNPNSVSYQIYFPLMQFRFISEKETVALIRLLPPNKSSQVDGLPMNFLKDAMLITSFCYILNECLSTQ